MTALTETPLSLAITLIILAIISLLITNRIVTRIRVTPILQGDVNSELKGPKLGNGEKRQKPHLECFMVREFKRTYPSDNSTSVFFISCEFGTSKHLGAGFRLAIRIISR